MSPLELLGFLPRPPRGEVEGVAKLLGGELMAYSSASSVVVVDVNCMKQATTLLGGHGNATVTALDWHPVGGLAESKTTPSLVLASGDTEGRVVVWDALLGHPIAALDDAYASGFGAVDGARRGDSPRFPVRALAWVTARHLLAVLLAPGYLVLWDHRSGGTVWRKDLGSSDSFTSMQTDPSDRRRLVLSTAAGAFAALRLDAPSADKTRYQRFQAEIAAGGTLQCALPGTRDLLLLVLQRELIAFDLEYGQPVASTSLPSGLAAFEAVLGSFGHSVAGVSPQQFGIDSLYCSHVDGTVSYWQRKGGASLEYSLVGSMPLAPSALVKAAGLHQGSGTGSGGGAQRLTIVAGPAGRSLTVDDSSSSSSPHSLSVLVLALAADGALWKWKIPLLVGTTESTTTTPSVKKDSSRLLGCLHSLSHNVTAFTAYPGIIALPPPPSSTSSTTSQQQQQPVLVAGVCAVGTASGTLELVTIQNGRLMPLHLSVSSSISVHSSTVIGLRWLGATSRVASFSSTRLTPSSSSSHHTSSSSNQSNSSMGAAAAGDWVNSLALTNFMSGGSVPFRDSSSPDRGPLVGIRASPCGAYLLLIFKGMASEVWATPEGALPFRLRQIDLQFTSVEWMLTAAEVAARRSSGGVHGGGGGMEPVYWKTRSQPEFSPSLLDTSGPPDSGDSMSEKVEFDPSNPFLTPPGSPKNTASSSTTTTATNTTTKTTTAAPPNPGNEDFPDERLVFTLADGRVGVLSVQGRRILDTKPRMPTWPQLASGEFRAACAASYGNLIFLGGLDGVLVRWDTSTGRTLAVDAGCGRIHGLVVAPTSFSTTGVSSPEESVDPGQIEVARIAVLAASGAFAVLALDVSGQIRPTAATWAAGAATLGRSIGIDWMVLPQPLGTAGVLAVVVESGAIAFIEVTGQRKGYLRHHLRLQQEHQEAGGSSYSLAPAPKLSSPLLLPRNLRMLLRLVLQRAVPAVLLRAATTGTSSSSGVDLEGLEAELRAWCLPPACAAAAVGGGGSSSCDGGNALFAVSPRSPDAATTAVSPTVGGSRGGEVRATGAMAALLQSSAAARAAGGSTLSSRGGGGVNGVGVGSPTGQQNSMEEAAMKLGYRQHSSTKSTSSRTQTFKSIGGAVKTMAKDVASVGKDQFTKTLGRAGGGGGGNGGNGDDSGGGGGGASTFSMPSSLHDMHLTPTEQNQQQHTSHPQHMSGVSPPPPGLISLRSRRRSSTETSHRPGSLVGALLACAEARSLKYPLNGVEMAMYEEAVLSGSVARQMEVAAVVGGCSEEARFWKRLPATLKALAHSTRTSSIEGKDKDKDDSSSSSSSTVLLWAVATELAAATERSGWHAKLNRRTYEASESLQEKRVLELLSLGDLHAAVGFLLSSPPGRSARFYRDALCTLGMAFACGLQKPSSNTSSSTAQNGNDNSTPSASEGSTSNSVLDDAARSLFVQVAKIVSANAAGVGDTLLGVPLMCATGEFDDAVNILQDAGMWVNAAALAAGSLSHASRAVPLERWAMHVADAEGRLWDAVGVMVGAGLLREAADLLSQSGWPDAAVALVAAASQMDNAAAEIEEEQIAAVVVQSQSPAGGEEGRYVNPFEEAEEDSSSRSGGARETVRVSVGVDEETAVAVNAMYERYTLDIVKNL